jgi:hypothetical protein
MSRTSENVGASTSRNPKGLHGLSREKFNLVRIIGFIDHLQVLTTINYNNSKVTEIITHK